MSFKKNKYQVIKGAISKELAVFIANYFCLQKQVYDTCIKAKYFSPYEQIIGIYEIENEQVPHTYSCYSDIAMETLLLKCQPKMEEICNLKLIPSYSYARIYKKGDELKRHKDRPSCEISTTLCLGGDHWPIYLDPTGADNVIDEYKNIHKPNAPKGVEVNLKPGDMLIYSGCELEHWREPFQGKMCGQVFLHYNHADGPFAKTNLYDKRPLLGIPKTR